MQLGRRSRKKKKSRSKRGPMSAADFSTEPRGLGASQKATSPGERCPGFCSGPQGEVIGQPKEGKSLVCGCFSGLGGGDACSHWTHREAEEGESLTGFGIGR